MKIQLLWGERNYHDQRGFTGTEASAIELHLRGGSRRIYRIASEGFFSCSSLTPEMFHYNFLARSL
jgi:hypothetical protein